MYQDSIDATRQVKPLRVSGRDNICAIYFRVAGKMQYVGTAPVPTSLFGDSPFCKALGFFPRGEA